MTADCDREERRPREIGSSCSAVELTEVDSLIAQHVTLVEAEVHWEDSCSGFQYESLEEAVEAAKDPAIFGFFSEARPESTVVEEVRTYPAYSTQLMVAFQVVDALGELRFRLQKSGGLWRASFGGNPEGIADTAPLAICLAALAEKGCKLNPPGVLRGERR